MEKGVGVALRASQWKGTERFWLFRAHSIEPRFKFSQTVQLGEIASFWLGVDGVCVQGFCDMLPGSFPGAITR